MKTAVCSRSVANHSNFTNYRRKNQNGIRRHIGKQLCQTQICCVSCFPYILVNRGGLPVCIFGCSCFAARCLKILRVSHYYNFFFAEKRGAFHQLQQFRHRRIRIQCYQVKVLFFRRQHRCNDFFNLPLDQISFFAIEQV